MYPTKKSLNTTKYSAFSPQFYPIISTTQDSHRFQYEREDFNQNQKNTRFQKQTQTYKGSTKSPSESTQTSKSVIVSTIKPPHSQSYDRSQNYMTISSKLQTKPYENIYHKDYRHFSKKGKTSVHNFQFDKFLQMAKKQKDRNIPSYSLMYTPKLPQYSYKTEGFLVQELRQTQDTIPENQSFYKCKSPTASDFYQVKLLGKGKNGQVYLAIHRGTGFACAMKIIKKSDINNGTPRQRQLTHNQLLRQIKVQLSMSDPNLIELYAVFSDKEHIFLIQQLGIDGQLYDLMRKNYRFSQESTALLSRQILKGLKYMHSRQIIHRDIKPQNIVLIYGIAKLCDFGWSVHCPLQLRSTLCGTPLYLSPQILIGDEYNQKIDIWAFGTLVYELFTDDNPFQIKNRSDLKKIVTEDLDFANNFPRRLRSFLEVILKKKSSERPTASELQGHEFLKKYAQLQTSQELANL